MTWGTRPNRWALILLTIYFLTSLLSFTPPHRTLSYLYLLMGIIVAPAVIPIAFTLTWSKQSATAAIVSALVSFVCGVVTWVATAGGLYGSVTVATTGKNIPMLAGNLMSLLLPFFITVPISLCKPDNFSWTQTIEGGYRHHHHTSSHVVTHRHRLRISSLH